MSLSAPFLYCFSGYSWVVDTHEVKGDHLHSYIVLSKNMVKPLHALGTFRNIQKRKAKKICILSWILDKDVATFTLDKIK